MTPVSKKFNLSIKKDESVGLEEDDISFESRIVRVMNEQRAGCSVSYDVMVNQLHTGIALEPSRSKRTRPNTTTSSDADSSDIVITEGTFSGLLPMDLDMHRRGVAGSSSLAVAGPSSSGAAGPSSSGAAGPSSSGVAGPSCLAVAEPSSSGVAGPFTSRAIQRRTSADTTNNSDIIITEGTFTGLLPIQDLPGPTRVVEVPTQYSDITVVSCASEIHEDDEEWSESQLSAVPDLSTAITSTPRRDLDQDGPMLIDLGHIRRTIRQEKEIQLKEARRWYLEVRDYLQSKTKPYSRKLKNRRVVLSNQIDEIRRQREALDQLIASLETESRDVERNIEYLETFAENFPAFPT